MSVSLKKRIISEQLKRLDSLYLSASSRSDVEHQKFYSKLALLECAGWVEESMDLIARRCIIKKHVKDRETIDSINFIIDHTYGFDYDKNFKKMLCQIIGVVEFYKIENQIDPLVLSTFKGALQTLKILRDSHAHTYILKTSQPFYDPSWTLGTFNNLYPALMDFYKKI